MKESLSPRELALAVGVSESSVKRWVDAGKIEAHKTCGGHRRIAVSEAVRYLRAARIELQDSSLLGIEVEVGRVFNDPNSQLLNSLKRGREEEVRALLVGLYLQGRSLAAIADGPLKYALQVLEDLSRNHAPGKYFQRRAVGIVVESLLYLRSYLTVSKSGVKAVGAAPEGDPMVLGSLSIRLVLEGKGIDATDLGPETPFETLRVAAEDLNARLVWLHLQNGRPAGNLASRIETLAHQLRRRNRVLVLKGAGLDTLRIPAGLPLRTLASFRALEDLVADL